jgi:hypothetical protein
MANLLSACGFQLVDTLRGASTWSYNSSYSFAYRSYSSSAAQSYSETQIIGVYRRDPSVAHVRLTANEDGTLAIELQRHPLVLEAGRV